MRAGHESRLAVAFQQEDDEASLGLPEQEER
jgi:hypothetical protein